MIELQASVNKTVLTISDVPKIASGSKNYVSVRFQFDSEWSSIQPVMVCYRDIKAPFYNEIIGGTAKIPHEVLRDPGPICIGVFGISGSTRITSTVCRIIIQQGAISQNIQQSDPSNDIWSQIMNQYQEIKDLCKNIIATSEEAAKKAQGFADNASYSATVASQQQQMASKHASTASEAATKCEEGVQKALTAAVTAQNAKDAAQSASNTAKSSATSAKAYAERAERATTGIETALSQANAAAQNAQEAKSAAQAASQDATKAADGAEAAKKASLTAQAEVNRGIADAMAAANKAEQAVGNIGSSVQQAQDAAKSASDSARAAALSKQGIETAEASAKESAKQAAASKTAVEQSATQASEAAARAQQSQIASAGSATSAQSSAAEASKQATASEASAVRAENAANEVEQSAQQIAGAIDRLAIHDTAAGNPTVIRDGADWQMEGLRVYGQSEQVTTTGANLLDCSNTMSNVGNTEVTLSGNLLTIINQNAYPAVVDIPITLDAGTYYMSVLSASVPVPIYRDGAWFSNGVSDNSKKSTIKIMDGGLYVCRITAEAQSTATVNELMISAKDVPYEPYTGGKPSPSPEYPQEIVSREVSSVVVTGSNLLPPDDYFETATNKYFCKNTGLLLRAGVKYVFSCDGGTTNLYIENKTAGETAVKGYDKTEVSYTPPKNGLYYFMMYNEKGVSNFTNFRVNVGSKMPYEPYHSQPVTLSAPVTLRGVPVNTGGNVTINGQMYAADRIVERDGAVGVERWTKRLELPVADMSNSESSPGWNRKGFTENLSNPVYSMSTHLPKNAISPNFKYDILFFRASGLTQSEWKSKHPDVVIGAVVTLEAPTFEPLPETDQAIRELRTYHGNTVVTTGAHTEVDYIADPKLYIDGVAGTINDIKSKIIELESKV